MNAYGFIVENQTNYGTDYVVARVMCRRDNENYPTNPGSRVVMSYADDEPKNLVGLYLDGLEIHGHEYTNCDGVAEYIGFTPIYKDQYSVDERQAKAMAKTLSKISKQIDKDNAREAGDILMSIAAALKLSFYVERTDNTPGTGHSYNDRKWRFTSVSAARDQLRNLIKTACQKEAV